VRNWRNVIERVCVFVGPTTIALICFLIDDGARLFGGQ